jgi:hypothetical protein
MCISCSCALAKGLTIQVRSVYMGGVCSNLDIKAMALDSLTHQ